MDKAKIIHEVGPTYDKATITTASGNEFVIKILRDGGEEIEITSNDGRLTILPVVSNQIRIK